MDDLIYEAKLLVVEAKEIADDMFDKDFSYTKVKHSIAILCRNYARLYAKLNEKEDK